MGWTYTNKPKGGNLTQFFIDQGVLRWSNGCPNTYRVLDSAVVKLHTYYAAIEQTNKESGEREVWAAIFLLDFKGDGSCNFGWKDMDETMGPCEAECPERILKLLTPTTNDYANDWRQRCWNNINQRKAQPKIAPGCTVVLFGREYAIAESLGRKGYAADGVADHVRYRIRLSQVPKISEVRPPAPKAAPSTNAAPCQVQLF